MKKSLSMPFVIISGTGIQEFVERHQEASAALESVQSLMGRRLPNVRFLDHTGRALSLAELRQLAEEEGDDANGP
jgi:hypothetical protein